MSSPGRDDRRDGPPAEDPRSWGRHRVALPSWADSLALVSEDGVSLVGARYRSTALNPTAVVLVHGFSGGHEQARVDRIARRLSAPGSGVCDVISVTMRGHGRSAGLTTIGHREPMDVEAACAFARDSGYQRVVTVGFSMGAAVVLRHAALRPQPRGYAGSDAVVAVSGPAFWYYRGTPPMRWLHRAVSSTTGRTYLRTALNTRVDPTPWPDPPPMPPTAAAERACENGTSLLVVHGDSDGFFPLDHPRALHAAAPGSQMWIEPGFGHAEGVISGALIDRIGAWARGDE